MPLRRFAVLAVLTSLAAASPSSPGARVTGRVFDEGGVPVPDASVELFGHAAVWLDGEPGCAVSLLACDGLDAGDEVLRRLDAGTLEFPAPLAKTSTDADGRFVFTDVGEDTFVVARAKGAALSRIVGGRLVERLELGEDLSVIDVSGAAAVPVTLVSPFTRRTGVVSADGASFGGQLARFTWARARVDAGVSTVLVPGARPRQLSVGTPTRFALSFDGGVVRSGHVRLTCAGFSREADVDGGVAVFDGVMGRCRASGAVDGFLVDRHQALDTRGGAGVVRVSPRATLEVSIDGAPVRAHGEVFVGPKGSRGLGGLGDAAGGARLEGNLARVENLPPGESELVVSGDGVVAAVLPVKLTAGLNRVRVTLAPSVRLEGVLLDERERPVVGATVRSAVPRREGQAKTDAAGRFAVELPDDAPVELSIDHPSLGTLTVVARPREPTRIVFRAERVLVVRAHFDGGVVGAAVRAAPLPEGVRSVLHVPAAASPARALAMDDAGVARWAGLWAGDCFVDVEAEGFLPMGRLVSVPDAGVVEVDFALTPSAVLQGTVSREGRPQAGVLVSLRDRGAAASPSVTTNAAGRFRFEGLAPGRHHLSVFPREGGRHELDVVAPTLDAGVALPW